MLELPEAAVIALQLNKYLKGRSVVNVTAAHTPNKFAWYTGDPQNYSHLLKGRSFTNGSYAGGMVQAEFDGVYLVFSDGVNLRFYYSRENVPAKHQLLLELDNNSFLAASIQMYGGILCFNRGECDNKYYLAAVASVSPAEKEFNKDSLTGIISQPELINKSVKFALAAGQRIPGLGNGVLQDILYTAGIHPKRKIGSLTAAEKNSLFKSIKSTVLEMIEKGGRDTEKDLMGNPGGYVTKLSKNTAGTQCTKCGSVIIKENYMGGSVYYCPVCQPLQPETEKHELVY